MQSYLPDINTKYITYARVVLSNISSKNWTACEGALNSENALLPTEYQITISTNEYNKLTTQNTVAICNFCKDKCKHCNEDAKECSAEINYNDIKVFDLRSDDFMEFVQGEKFDKAWFCPKCNNINKLSHTRMIKSKLPEPHFLKVVPERPIRKDGLLDRSSHDKKSEWWVWNFQNELDYQMALFRAANWNKETDESDNEEIDTNREENM